mmetsp:Transcript_66400/g.216061  ORF Transcript_66400/g.216061 Transcript_66400/m.216061 type:complete len:323 (+) Transcript_66400:569-1537(+)
MQVPLQEGHCLDVQELVLDRRADDVGVPNSDSSQVGGDLHDASRLHETSEGPEEQAHEVLVAPIHDRVPVKEALDRPGMREVVVHGAQRLLQALELVIDRDPGAIHSVPHLREVVLLQGLDGVVDLLVALPERVEVLEGRRDDAADMTQGLAVLGELQREGQVRVPEDRSVSHRIDELEPSEAAHGSQARCLRDGCCRGVVIDVVFVLRLLNDLLQLLRPVVRRQHEAQLPMLQASEDLVFGQVQLPAVGEGSHCIASGTPRQLGLAHLTHVPRQELARRLPLVELVRDIPRLDELIEILHRRTIQHVLHDLVLSQAPLDQQ